MAYSVDEFAAIIKNKYPDYADRDNSVLVSAWLKKYPEYSDRVTLAPSQPSPTTTQARPSAPIPDWPGKAPVVDRPPFPQPETPVKREPSLVPGEAPGLLTRAWRGITESSPEQQTAQAQNLMQISKATGAPLSKVTPEQQIEFARAKGAATQPTGGELANAGMMAGMAIGGGEALAAGTALKYAGHLALTVGAFEGLNKLIPTETFIPTDANDATRTAIEIADFIAKGAVAGKVSGASKLVGDFIKAKFTDTGIAEKVPPVLQDKIIDNAVKSVTPTQAELGTQTISAPTLAEVAPKAEPYTKEQLDTMERLRLKLGGAERPIQTVEAPFGPPEAPTPDLMPKVESPVFNLEKEVNKYPKLGSDLRSRADTIMDDPDNAGLSRGEALEIAVMNLRQRITEGGDQLESAAFSKFDKSLSKIENKILEAQNAQKTGTEIKAPSQEVGAVQGPGVGVPVRNPAENWLEAPKGEVAPPVEPKPVLAPETPVEKVLTPAVEPPKPPVAPLSEDGASGSAKPRGFIKTMETSNATTPGLKEQVLDIKPQEYQELPNADVLKSADAVIAKKGTVKALADIMATENPSIEDTGVAIRLMKIYETREDYDKVIPLIDKFDSVFRKSGRMVQLASLWNRLTPNGFVKTIDATIGKMGVALDAPFKQMLTENMRKIRLMPEGEAKTKATFELLNSVYDKVPFKAKLNNWLEGYRYTNMLSNPLTHERNLYGNLLQTFVTRPLDMAGQWGYGVLKDPFNPIARDIKLMDLPRYYQSVFKSIPEAGRAFVDTLGLDKISSKVVESPTESANFVNEALRSKLPKALKIIPNAMEAADRFFSIMIASGEKARLVRGGASEAVAESKAKDLAEKMLYREKLGSIKKGDAPLFVRALDELGQIVLSARHKPVIGKPVSWFVPFVTTPINIAKASVERSPLGLIGGNYSEEQMGKALVGTAVSLVGASMALAGKVTWMPPKGDRERTAFYNSGRTPMSVEIGGKYIPAWYFGPYAIAFMLPAAFQDKLKDTNQRLSLANIEAVSKAILSSGRLITEQTPLAGVKDLTDIITGRETVSSKILARPAAQLIPFVGALRFVANIVDPIYRKGNGLIDELKKNIPGLTEDLKAYEKSPGVPSTRNFASKYLPYTLNTKDSRADIEFRNIEEVNKQDRATRDYWKQRE